MNYELSPQIAERLNMAAQMRHIDPTKLLESLVEDTFPPVPSQAQSVPVIDGENAAVIALMDEWLAEAPNDPQGIRQAQAEVDELMQTLNKNRIESGESPILI